METRVLNKNLGILWSIRMSTCRSLFNLEGALERLCTFKRGKEKIKILMSLNYLGV